MHAWNTCLGSHSLKINLECDNLSMPSIPSFLYAGHRFRNDKHDQLRLMLPVVLPNTNRGYSRLRNDLFRYFGVAIDSTAILLTWFGRIIPVWAPQGSMSEVADVWFLKT